MRMNMSDLKLDDRIPAKVIMKYTIIITISSDRLPALSERGVIYETMQPIMNMYMVILGML